MRERLTSIDLLRGIVMMIMAIDHTRDFFYYPHANPTDLATTSPELFFTRWITHYCAPVFVFLAGTGAFLSTTRGKTPKELSWFLLTRGAWLIILEITLVRAGWMFTLTDFHMLVGQVIWAIGWSMIALSALVFLPVRAVGIFGVVMILLHNAFDGIHVNWQNPLGWLWAILHTGDILTPTNGVRFLPLYPLIPWIGVMAAGYAFGQFYTKPADVRNKQLRIFGLALIGAFILVRAINIYGDPSPWSLQKDVVFNVLSFLNCSKYPPSLCYLLMTLGPAILFLSVAERFKGALTQIPIVFGKVPMFYYLLHVPLIHGLSVLFEYFRTGDASWMLSGNLFTATPPADFGYGLPAMYAVWLLVLAILYPLCVWYSKLKMQSKNPLLSYL
ncbi:MAG: DUF1624 domain-containing protein [Candidatus Kapabacteria bacterium]|nr:DUF1624 domain-containing protein [Candidatus Kapabacteria bacterium]